MALILEANYSKKIGLPGYSSHQFSLTLKTEVSDPAQIQAESNRLYAVLQSSVDQSLRQVGWLPEGKPSNGNGNGNGHGHTNGNGHAEKWNCSDKQRDLITRIIEENRLDKSQIEELAQERFGKGVRQLNKLEASGLIDELFERHGGKNGNGHHRFNGRATHPR
jgi:hypothetical protein